MFFNSHLSKCFLCKNFSTILSLFFGFFCRYSSSNFFLCCRFLFNQLFDTFAFSLVLCWLSISIYSCFMVLSQVLINLKTNILLQYHEIWIIAHFIHLPHSHLYFSSSSSCCCFFFIVVCRQH